MGTSIGIVFKNHSERKTRDNNDTVRAVGPCFNTRFNARLSTRFALRVWPARKRLLVLPPFNATNGRSM
ncbi:hypothetical protein DQ400_19135 [Vreelandella sulfidaeris]|uniref:Uncharacterized protein n=1 Tax=Vreelandella sulfidaeris TaxID=115553 RepID=A0A365TI73_9GAMM|nr:hypothetical protein DQ400_19135 [Halomonas sulfidaeris]